MKKDLLPEQKEQILRMREIRENLGFSQEQFASILSISISAYKKIESYENQISLTNLIKLHSKLKVSPDYILFGEKNELEDVWKNVVNCNDQDKIVIFLRLYNYFAHAKTGVYPTDDKELKDIEKILCFIDSMQKAEKDNDA